MRIGIAVQRQDTCSVASQRMNYCDNDKNKVYVNIIVNFYVMVHSRRRWVGTYWEVILRYITLSRGSKDGLELSELSQTDPIQADLIQASSI